jgi:hypothetical protein
MSRSDTLKRGAKSTALQRILSGLRSSENQQEQGSNRRGRPGSRPGRLGRQARPGRGIRLGPRTGRDGPDSRVAGALVVALGDDSDTETHASADDGHRHGRLPGAGVFGSGSAQVLTGVVAHRA